MTDDVYGKFMVASNTLFVEQYVSNMDIKDH
jgi:hypothetical protein